jgi:hypothetical protein
MTATHTRTKILTAAVGAVVATIAAPALLFLSAGNAQAVIHYIPTPRDCAGCDGFSPQPDTPDDPDLRPPLTRSPSLDPGDTVGIIINYWGAP